MSSYFSLLEDENPSFLHVENRSIEEIPSQNEDHLHAFSFLSIPRLTSTPAKNTSTNSNSNNSEESSTTLDLLSSDLITPSLMNLLESFSQITEEQLIINNTASDDILTDIFFNEPSASSAALNNHSNNHFLTEQERDRRRSTKYRSPFNVIGVPPTNIFVNTKIPSFFWPIYQELFTNISEHLHIDMAIIDYNYARLSKCIDIWAKEGVFRFKKKPHEVTLDQKEYAIALEFYLQIDVDLFYMKTCSFRNVQPQKPNEFLFCSTDPIARYEMSACGNCCLCYPKYNVQRRGQPSVEFGTATQRHQFLNKYETILNCPCSCDTHNIIYVLTCPCGKFDYIGESGASLADRIQYHRDNGNRIIHEAFLGQNNIKLAYPNYVKTAETLSKDEMRLYRHSTECPTAIQMFLDENPRYWRLVPMSSEDANKPEQTIITSTMDIKSTDIQENDQIKLFLKNLPIPPSNYQFSTRQYHLQYAYFKSRRHFDQPNKHLDLYNAKIIVVLPETGSTVLRKIVESLLITHAETKLNSSGRLVDAAAAATTTSNSNHNDNDDAASNHHENVVWCEGLVRRPLTTFITAEPSISTTATTT